MGRQHRIRGSECGTTSIEAGLIAALAVVVIIGALTALGSSLNTEFKSTGGTVEPASDASSSDDLTETAATAGTPTDVPATREPISAQTTISPATVTPSHEAQPEILIDTLCWTGPGSAYEVVSAVKSDIFVKVQGLGQGGGWLVIENPLYPGVVCWVVEDAVSIPEGMAVPDKIFAIPPVPTSTPETGGSTVQGCMVNGNCTVPCPDSENFPACTP